MKALVEVCSLRLPFLLEYQHHAVDTIFYSHSVPFS